MSAAPLLTVDKPQRPLQPSARSSTTSASKWAPSRWPSWAGTAWGRPRSALPLMGLTPPHVSGSVRFEGKELLGRPSYKVAALGPRLMRRRGDGPFRPSQSTSISRSRRETAAADGRKSRVYDLFPRLAERKRNGGAELSGGEQQMLAIGRALLGNPKLMIMDEPSEGLAPADRRYARRHVPEARGRGSGDSPDRAEPWGRNVDREATADHGWRRDRVGDDVQRALVRRRVAAAISRRRTSGALTRRARPRGWAEEYQLGRMPTTSTRWRSDRR